MCAAFWRKFVQNSIFNEKFRLMCHALGGNLAMIKKVASSTTIEKCLDLELDLDLENLIKKGMSLPIQLLIFKNVDGRALPIL